MAGRLAAIRGHGKTVFSDLHDSSGKIQLYLRRDNLKAEEIEILDRLDLGDIVGAEGELFTTRKGEISVVVRKLTLLSKALLPLPEKWHGLKDREIRYRRRHLDLISNREVAELFRTRSRIIREIRNFLDRRGFLEVETPTAVLSHGDNRINYGPFMYHDITVENLGRSALSGSILVALDGGRDSSLSTFDSQTHRVIHYRNPPDLQYSYDYKDGALTEKIHQNDGYSGHRALAMKDEGVSWRIGTAIYEDFADDGALSNQTSGEGVPGGMAFSFSNLSGGGSLKKELIYAGFTRETACRNPPSDGTEDNTYYFYYTMPSPDGFSGLGEVMNYAVSNRDNIVESTDNFESKLKNARLPAELKWVIAQGYHSYMSNTFLLRRESQGNRPYWYVMEGNIHCLHTLDLIHEHAVFTGREVPWTLRLGLDQYAGASFTTDSQGNNSSSDYLWLHHDVGNRGTNPNRVRIRNAGGGKKFRLEENLNYVLLSYWYWKATGNNQFFENYDYAKLDFIKDLLAGSLAADQKPPDVKDGIADAVDFLGGQQTGVTTYDTPEYLSGLARPWENTYIGVKQMASYIAAAELFSSFGRHTGAAATYLAAASTIKATLLGLHNKRSYIPVSFADETEAKYKSPVVNEGLLYLVLSSTTSPLLDRQLLSALEDNYRDSYAACRTSRSPYGNKIIKLTTAPGIEPIEVSWLSKILNQDFISQQMFDFKTDSHDFIYRSLSQCTRGWNDTWLYSKDLVYSNLRMYPRGLVSWAFLASPPNFRHRVYESGDYDGDGTSDIAVFRPGTGLWAVRLLTRVYFGGSRDVPVPGDYDGDNTTDYSVFRPDVSFWAIRGATSFYFGDQNDIPVPGDYNGNGTANPAVFRPGTGLWAVRNLTRIYYGQSGDIPIPGDYRGSGSSAPAVFRPSTGLWAARGVSQWFFGGGGDVAIPGDYTGDGTDNAAVFRHHNGLWAIRGVTRHYYGGPWDRAVPADYDGSGILNLAVFRPGNSLWAARGVTRCFFGRENDLRVVK